MPRLPKAVEWLLGDPDSLANAFTLDYRQQMIKRGLPITMINRRLTVLRSLIKPANTLGLVPWTLWVKNLPVQPYRNMPIRAWRKSKVPSEILPSLRGILYTFKQYFSIGISEVARLAVPVQCGRQIALYPPNMRASKERGVKRTAKPQCGSSISRCRCAFIKKPGGGYVTGGEKCVSSRQ
jgi:hypothetical protein